jgi:hypothetical protein
MGQAMSTATRLWTLTTALNNARFSFFPSFIIYCVPVCLRRMGQAMSTATRPWTLTTALNNARFCTAFAASITFQDHPLLRCSQQMLSNSEVDTTPLVAACCAGPIFCHFFSIAQFTIKTIPVSCSRTSAARWIVDKNSTIIYRDKHAGIAVV